MKVLHPRDMSKDDAGRYRKALKEARETIKTCHEREKQIQDRRFKAMLLAADLQRAIEGFAVVPVAPKGRAPKSAPPVAAKKARQ